MVQTAICASYWIYVMGDLREIVEVAAVERLFLLLAVIGPIVGLIIGAAVGVRRQEARRGALLGLLVGMFGPLNWLLWRVYNVLTDRNGLDTVRNLVINLALFIVVGGVIGIALGAAFRRGAEPPKRDEGGPSLVGAGVSGPSPGRDPGEARRLEDSDAPPRDP